LARRLLLYCGLDDQHPGGRLHWVRQGSFQLSPFAQISTEAATTGGIDLQEDIEMHVALAERPTTLKSRDRYDLSTLARQQLERHPHFRGRMCDIHIKHEDRNLYLTGRLPTFYLKQLVQEAVRHLPGVDFVYNEIDVVSPEGISSVRY
jgi:osmotically-inducible protein OsmY